VKAWLLFKQHEPVESTADFCSWVLGSGAVASIAKVRSVWLAWWRGAEVQGVFRSRAAARHGLEKHIRQETRLHLEAIGQGYLAVRLGL
jgi:hypothetical protein